MSATLGTRFAEALGAKDFSAISSLLDPDVDFKGLTPGRHWDASDAQTVNEILQRWFEEEDDIKHVMRITAGAVGDRRHVSYRFMITNPDGDFETEQQMYYEEDGNRITMMRILCSGYQPA